MNDLHEQNEDLHGCYEVRLNRFFNILQKENAISGIVFLAFSAVCFVSGIVFRDQIEARDLLFPWGAFAVWMIARLLSYPKCIDVNPSSNTARLF